MSKADKQRDEYSAAIAKLYRETNPYSSYRTNAEFFAACRFYGDNAAEVATRAARSISPDAQIAPARIVRKRGRRGALVEFTVVTGQDGMIKMATTGMALDHGRF